MTESNIGIESSSHSHQINPEVMKSKVIKMIVFTKLAFSFGENKYFTEWCQYLNIGYVPTTQNTNQGVVIKNYDFF